MIYIFWIILAFLWANFSVFVAFAQYAKGMKANSTLYRNLIIRSQVEYNASTQTVIFRCILETPSLGQRQGFTDLEALLTALRTELTEFQSQIIPAAPEKGQI